MPYKLKILSPLHIGCGEEYNAISYLLDRRRKPFLINKIDADILFNSLNDYQKANFVSWVEGNNNDPNLFHFFKNVLKDANFTFQNQIQKRSIYTIPYYGDDEKIRNINSFIKQMNRPYIPGSEIKGAIRTAVLYGQLVNNPDLMMLLKDKLTKFGNDNAREIDNVRNSSKPDRKTKNNLVKQMEKIESAFQEEVLNSIKGDAKYDVMKYLMVGDSELLDADKVLAVSRTEVYTPQRTGRPSHNEFIIPGNTISLTSLAIEANKSLVQKLERMGFTDRQKQIVSGMDVILDYYFRFSNDLLQEEIHYFKNQHKSDIVAHLEDIKSQNSKESPVFRIGKDEGFNSLTVGMAIKKMAYDLYKDVLTHATKGKSYDSEFPKSRKIIQWNGKELTAGWVQLIPADKANTHELNTTASTIGLQKNTPALDLSGLKDKFGGKGSR